MKRIALLWLVVGAGCGASSSYGAGAAGAHPPPLPPGASLPKWDHFCSILAKESEITRYLDEASENSWELVSWSIGNGGNLACFKRPRVAATTPSPAPVVAPAAPSAGH